MAAKSGQDPIPVIGFGERIERIGIPNRPKHCTPRCLFLTAEQRFLFHHKDEDTYLFFSLCLGEFVLHPAPGGPQSAVIAASPCSRRTTVHRHSGKSISLAFRCRHQRRFDSPTPCHCEPPQEAKQSPRYGNRPLHGTQMLRLRLNMTSQEASPLLRLDYSPPRSRRGLWTTRSTHAERLTPWLF